MIPPTVESRSEAAAQQARTDLFLLLGQAVLTLMAGAWAAKAAAPQLHGAAWMGSVLLLTALVCAYGSVRVLVATVLAPWAVLQLIQRVRDPRQARVPTTASERRFSLAMNAIAMVTFVSVALAAATALWWLADGVDLVGALWRFGVSALVLALSIPRAIRALG
ncbi:hypothetical protein [Pseudoxanthomonas indica]|uniref:Uncharacterized protein n=1 Tax=Pseudoxanthomonas indica TaxID=428993 RepID=A0A1T5KNG4_9GAMM|nr:hypothetical protein [Pseudoxanthomonas indica]GGD50392.1 hypothetical protein GCM10007235_23110 [Pseudoxanthomonas indica]SKC65171.1 hypothetical protein SAMN06296058_1857 [Pseudoxanthomonas indica]